MFKMNKIWAYMKLKIVLLLFTIFLFTSCFHPFHDEIKGHAVIVDNFKDKTPLKGVYIEVEHTEDEGYNYYVIGSATTDSTGYFNLDIVFESAIFTIDAWSIAYVYSDTFYTDTLGNFSFQFAEDTYNYKTIHIDTLCLEHNVWVVPRIGSLGDNLADELSTSYHNCPLVDAQKENVSYCSPFYVGQTFDPFEIKMTMRLQHWLTFGSRELGFVVLKKDSETIGYGGFTLVEFKHTNEGDTLYVNFDVHQDQ